MKIGPYAEHYISAQVVEGEHDTLRESRRAGSIVDDSGRQTCERLIADIRWSKSAGIALAEISRQARDYRLMGRRRTSAADFERNTLGDDRTRVERHHSTQQRHGVEVHVMEQTVGHKEHHRIGVIDDIGGVDGIEVVKDRHYHGTVGDGGHEGDDPVRSVTAQERNLVARPNSGSLEEKVQTGYAARHIAVCQRFACHIVGQCRKREVIRETVPVYFKQVVIRVFAVWFFKRIIHKSIVNGGVTQTRQHPLLYIWRGDIRHRAVFSSSLQAISPNISSTERFPSMA